MISRSCIGPFATGVSLLAATSALAQPATNPSAGATTQPEDGLALEEIIVTAQKRSESLQNVPASITALSGDALSNRAIDGLSGLATSVPSLTFGSYGGSARIAVRGIGFDMINPGGEGRIAYHINGVYVSRPAATMGTFYDVERVEVLRGPQGTLYGRNATGGSINVITRKPGDKLEGFLELGYGNYNDLSAEGAVSVPLSEGLGARVAFIAENRDGYGKNIVTGKDIDNSKRFGMRGTLSAKLGDSGKFDLIGDYYQEHDRNYGNHYFGQANPFITPSGFLFGGVVPTSRRDIANDFDPKNERTFWGVSGRGEFDLGGVTLTSLTGYRHSNWTTLTDLDLTSAPLSRFTFFEKSRQISQELQLSGDIGHAKFIVGGYYFNEKISGGSKIPLDSALVGLSGFVQGYRAQGDFKTDALAGFGQVDYAVSDTLTLTLGARYSWEKKKIDDLVQFDLFTPYPPELPPNPLFVRSGSRSETAFTPKFGLEYKPRHGLMIYATVSKGFKSGGFNIGDANNGFEPETLWSYEAGMKGTFADGRVRINASGFYYDYKNLQVSKVVVASVTIENAAASTLYGAEAEITVVPTDGLRLEVSPTWLHSKYKDFQSANPADPANPNPVVLDGNQLVQAPELALNTAIEYEFAVGSGRLSLRGEANWQDRIYFTPFNERAVSRAPNTKLNAFIRYDVGNWGLTLYGRNLANKTTIANALVNSIVVGAPFSGTLEPPRTYGVKVSYHF